MSEEVKAATPVVVIGCGMAGILAGIRLKQAGLPFRIIEKNMGPGGTWWENRYPGARVDIGSHQYCYSFEPPDHWSEFYCQQPELMGYFSDIVEKYDLRSQCQFDTTVTKLRWDHEDAQWRVHISDAGGTEDVIGARFVISAVGSLNIPKLPDIPGMETFGGPSFHSARWPHDLNLTGKRFALVGAGASGFQIGPAIAGDVEQLTIFQAHCSVDHLESAVPRDGVLGGGPMGAAAPAVLWAVVQVHRATLVVLLPVLGPISDRTRV